jgi:hypothetical protein
MYVPPYRVLLYTCCRLREESGQAGFPASMKARNELLVTSYRQVQLMLEKTLSFAQLLATKGLALYLSL